MNAKLLGCAAMLSVVSFFPACRGGDRTADTAAGTTAAGMAGMGAMDSTAREAMMNQMHTHMVTMERASADSAKAMLTMHQQMLANMISEFDREARQMNMTGDSTWRATMDSLRQDSTRMAQLSATELKTLIPAHHGRIMRLMASHRSMMSHKM